ncbi:MAG: rhodanese-like domain-containing protein [Gammaproteobacteria bacterium]|jgi:thiosulfate/3-mercaptopyruvate sulfurtransferase
MDDIRLPLVVEPDQLVPVLENHDLLVVDLCKPETYAQGHIPGAVHLDYKQIIAAQKPVMGLVPDADHLGQLMSQIGATPQTHIVAYDDEGGGRAARLLYTLDIMQHNHYSLLNGGIHAWANEGHPLETTVNTRATTDYAVTLQQQPVATKDFILQRLGDPQLALIDARTPAEYSGEKKLAARGGHIPGATNLDWVNLIDRQHNMRLKPDSEIKQLLANIGVNAESFADNPVVVYCQTHHRSALTYIALKNLGYSDVKGYPGSWSEWGNADDTPVET